MTHPQLVFSEVSLPEYLSQYKKRSVSVLLNWGNAGDSYIQQGLWELLRLAEIQPDQLFYIDEEDKSGDLLLVVGAGGFCGHAIQMVRIHRYFQSFRQIIILPSSIDATNEVIGGLVENLPTNTIVFCRDSISLERVLQKSRHPHNVFLARDLAFHRSYSRRSGGIFRKLVAFRLDSESQQQHVPRRSIDASGLGDHTSSLPIDVLLWLFKEVHTDRLHVGLPAALMGKKVVFYDNSYGKIQGVYDTFLKSLDNVEFRREQASQEMSFWPYTFSRCLTPFLRATYLWTSPKYFFRSVYRKLKRRKEA